MITVSLNMEETLPCPPFCHKHTGTYVNTHAIQKLVRTHAHTCNNMHLHIQKHSHTNAHNTRTRAKQPHNHQAQPGGSSLAPQPSQSMPESTLGVQVSALDLWVGVDGHQMRGGGSSGGLGMGQGLRTSSYVVLPEEISPKWYTMRPPTPKVIKKVKIASARLPAASPAAAEKPLKPPTPARRGNQEYGQSATVT